MDASALLVELFGRVPEIVGDAVEGLSPEQLRETPVRGANPIGWLVWHLARVEDIYGAEYTGGEQLWTAEEWPPRFGLPSDPHDSGYGHSAADVAKVAPESAAACVEYHAAVHARLVGFVRTVSSVDLDKVIDASYDPPVTLGVRLVSIADDCLQHAGQAAYLRGLLLAK